MLEVWCRGTELLPVTRYAHDTWQRDTGTSNWLRPCQPRTGLAQASDEQLLLSQRRELTRNKQPQLLRTGDMRRGEERLKEGQQRKVSHRRETGALATAQRRRVVRGGTAAQGVAQARDERQRRTGDCAAAKSGSRRDSSAVTEHVRSAPAGNGSSEASIAGACAMSGIRGAADATRMPDICLLYTSPSPRD